MKRMQLGDQPHLDVKCGKLPVHVLLADYATVFHDFPHVMRKFNRLVESMETGRNRVMWFLIPFRHWNSTNTNKQRLWLELWHVNCLTFFIDKTMNGITGLWGLAPRTPTSVSGFTFFSNQFSSRKSPKVIFPGLL